MGCSIVETFSKDVKPKELEEVLRLEYRSKLLNPKWAQVCHSTQQSFCNTQLSNTTWISDCKVLKEIAWSISKRNWKGRREKSSVKSPITAFL